MICHILFSLLLSLWKHINAELPTAGRLSDFEEQSILITHRVLPKHGYSKATGIGGIFVAAALSNLS